MQDKKQEIRQTESKQLVEDKWLWGMYNCNITCSNNNHRCKHNTT